MFKMPARWIIEVSDDITKSSFCNNREISNNDLSPKSVKFLKN